MWVFLFFSNAWGRNFAIYLRRKTPIKHMNLRHVNIVSQSYIGNTALRVHFQTKMGCSRPGCPSCAATTGPRSPRLRPGCFSPRWGLPMVLRARKRAALHKICSQKKAVLRGSAREEGERRNTAREWACLLHQATPFPKESHIVMVLPKTTIKKQTRDKAPPAPPGNP